MHTPGDPPNTVASLLDSSHVTPVTRRVLQQRLAQPPVTRPRYFDPADFAILKAACARLVPQPTRLNPIDVAGAIDTRLAQGEGDGWRYATMPPDGAAYRLGLHGIDEAAQAAFQTSFLQLDDRRQDQVLLAIQHGEVNGGVWRTLPSRRFFESLLTGAAEAYYAHPTAQQQIDCVAMADAKGWQAVGLDQHQAPQAPLRKKRGMSGA